MKKLGLLLLGLFITAQANAATVYICTSAAGNGSGSSLANCKDDGGTNGLTTILNSANDYRLVNGAGRTTATYNFTASGPLLASNTSIIGWDRDTDTILDVTSFSDAETVVLTGVDPTTYDVSAPESKTTYGLRAVDDADNITLKNFNIKYFRYNVDFAGKSSNTAAPTTANHTGVVIQNVISEITDQAFTFAGEKTTDQGYKDIASMSGSGNTITVDSTPATSWTFANNDPVGVLAYTMPTGLSRHVTYYVKNYSSGTFQLSATAGGAAIDISGSIDTGIAFRAPPESGNTDVTMTHVKARNYARAGYRVYHRLQSFTATDMYAYGDDKDSFVSGTVTSSDTSSPYNGDIITSNSHGLSTGQAITFKSTSSPGGLTNRTTQYWPVNITTNTFSVAASEGGAAINMTSAGSGVTWHRSYNTQNQQTGIEFGVSSGGTLDTAEWNNTITNFYCSDHNDRENSGSRQGDCFITERLTKGTVDTADGSTLSYTEYCSDNGLDSKGTWTVTDLISKHNAFGSKSYGNNGNVLTLNNVLEISSECLGGTQCTGDARVLTGFGDLTANFSTFYNHSESSAVMVRIPSSGGADSPTITLVDSLTGFLDAYSGASFSEESLAKGTYTKTRTDYYTDNPSSGTDPDFVDVTDTDYDGGTSWNSQLYGPEKGFFMPGTLTSTNVEPASLSTGASGNVTVSFTTAFLWPSDGTVVVTFPTSLGSGFTFNDGGTTTAGSLSGIDGTLTVVVASNVLTMTRGGVATDSAAGAKSFVLSNVKNPTVAGTTGLYEIKTTKSNGNTVDEEDEVTADILTSPPDAGGGSVGTTVLTGTFLVEGTVTIL